MEFAALVPARRGSKGLPGKNLAFVGGRSLIARAVELALEVPRISTVIVTSDDDEVLAVARSFGVVAARRPPGLARDDTPVAAVLNHLLHDVEQGGVVLLQPTSPLRQRQDVEACLSAVEDGAPSAVTVTETHPVQWSFRRGPTGVLHPVVPGDVPARRQEALDQCRLNGAVYAADRHVLLIAGTFLVPGVVGIPMPKERSVDIDDAVDLALANVLAGSADRQDSR